MWIIAEVNRDKKKRRQPFTIDTFHPMSQDNQASSSTFTPLTRSIWRERARQWYRQQGLPIPAKLDSPQG